MSTNTPSPAELLRRHGLYAKKHWGQNFLHDVSVVHTIIERTGIAPTDTVVEIGAGLGAMTVPLSKYAQNVIAIERDRDLVAVLREELAAIENITIAEQNALSYPFDGFDAPVVVVGNLPYHISSPLLFHILAHRQQIRVAALMFQRELAQRICAAPGTRLYGAPSVSCQQYAEASICVNVGSGAFFPPPRVDSAVVLLKMRAAPLHPADPDLFRLTVQTAFAQRRKTLRRALSALFPSDTLIETFSTIGIDPKARAETLTVGDFARIAKALGELREQKSE